MLSIRGSDFEADPGALPAASEQTAWGMCIARIANARHNGMRDAGPAALRAEINALVARFLAGGSCGG